MRTRKLRASIEYKTKDQEKCMVKLMKRSKTKAKYKNKEQKGKAKQMITILK